MSYRYCIYHVPGVLSVTSVSSVPISRKAKYSDPFLTVVKRRLKTRGFQAALLRLRNRDHSVESASIFAVLVRRLRALSVITGMLRRFLGDVSQACSVGSHLKPKIELWSGKNKNRRAYMAHEQLLASGNRYTSAPLSTPGSQSLRRTSFMTTPL